MLSQVAFLYAADLKLFGLKNTIASFTDEGFNFNVAALV
jgi:hypothetical protein